MTASMKNAPMPAEAAKQSNGQTGILKRTSAYLADVRAIRRRPGFNPRFDFGDLDGLAQSIKANGILMPLRVKRLAEPGALRESAPGVYEVVPKTEHVVFELIDGDRRFSAIELLLSRGEKFPDGVPVILVDKGQDDVTSLIQMFETNSGKKFLPLEEAAAFKRMQDAGMTLKQIEERTGRSDNAIVGALALLSADPSLRDAVEKGEVSGGLAKSIAVNARGNAAKQAELVKQAKAAGKDKTKVRAVKKAVDDERRAKAAKRGLKLKMRALSDDELSTLGAGLAARMIDKVRDAGMAIDSDLRAWVAADDKLALAFTLGALEALKAAAGMKIELDI